MSARVLVLGGSGVLGYHVVTAALARGHDVTVFSRSGRAPADGVRVLTGDREDDVDALHGAEWDAVVDTYTDDAPGAPAVRRTAQLLSGAVGTYCYVSGMSVYAPAGPLVPDEGAPVRHAGVEPDDDPLQARSLAKLAGEHAVSEAFDGAVLLPRVGIMVGPRDPSRRFTWWPARFLRALTGDAPPRVACPGRADRPVQYSDARDTAAWLVDAAVAGRAGTYNTVGPLRGPGLLGDPCADVLHACLSAARRVAAEQNRGDADRDVELVWSIDEDALRGELAAVDDEDRPLWYPEDQIPQDAIDSSAAARAGLTYRPAADTAFDTLVAALAADERPLPDFAEPS